MSTLLQQFITEASDLVADASRGLARLRQAPGDREVLNLVFRAVHTVKGGSGLFALSSLTEAVHAAEDVLARVRDETLAPSEPLLALLLAAMDQLVGWLGELEESGALSAASVSAGRLCAAELRALLPSQGTEAVVTRRAERCALSSLPAALQAAATALHEAGATAFLIRYEPERDCFFRGEDPLHSLSQLPGLQALQVQAPEVGLSALVDLDPFLCDLRIVAVTEDDEALIKEVFLYVADEVTVQRIDPAPLAVAEPAGAPAGAPARRTEGRTILRVEQGRIDQFMDLVGELVVAKNSLPYLARRAEQSYAAPALARELKEQYQVLHRIAEDLQAAVMQVRMVPLSVCFERAGRLVRDLSRKLDKPAELTQEGEDTEADKSIVDRLGDPLLHLLRNSMDHGLEPIAARAAAGKPRQGALRLRASRVEEQLVIEMSDDGQGIDPARIRRSAVAKGLMDEAQAQALTTEQAQAMIFAPGFSTAAVVSDVSGRGVGMDVVRRDIEALGGTVTLRSQVGQGTTVTLAVPLTMTITRALTVRVAGQLFGVPLDGVVAVVRVPQESVRSFRQHECVVWRDRVLSLRSLARLLDAPQQGSPSDGRCAFLVVRSGTEEVGLLVDSFEENVDIIVKPISGVLSACRGLMGTAILGDGRALLVLNLREILSWPLSEKATWSSCAA